MPTSLTRGIYEALITENLARDLVELTSTLTPERSALRAVEAPDRVALHLARAVERALAGISDDDERLRIAVDVVRRLLDTLRGVIASFEGDADRLVEPAEMLRAVVARRCDIDWARIAALAERYHARLHLRDAFLCLRHFGFAVPDALLAEWAQARSPADELHYELALTPRPPRFFAALPRFRFWKSYRMKSYIEQGANGGGRAGVAQRLAGFPPYVVAFVKADLDAARLRDVPGRLGRKLAGRPWLLRP